jgi:hypothetical protein
MKLYTEEQVKKMIEKSQYTGLTADFLILAAPSVQLPTDEEIEKESNNEYQEQKQSYENSVEMFPIDFANYLEVGFIEGAKWMRNKIQRDKQ